MKLIDQDKMLEKLEQLPADQFFNVASIRNFIKAAPEAVVRCKDCKMKFLENGVWNCAFGLTGGPEFFCSMGVGEKKDDA